MGLTIVLNGACSKHCYVDCDSAAQLFALADEQGLCVFQCGTLLNGPLDTQLSSPGEVAECKTELAALAVARREKLAHEKGVRARDPKTRSQIVERIAADDPLSAMLRELVELCEAALDADTGLMGFGQ